MIQLSASTLGRDVETTSSHRLEKPPNSLQERTRQHQCLQTRSVSHRLASQGPTSTGRALSAAPRATAAGRKSRREKRRREELFFPGWGFVALMPTVAHATKTPAWFPSLHRLSEEEERSRQLEAGDCGPSIAAGIVPVNRPQPSPALQLPLPLLTD